MISAVILLIGTIMMGGTLALTQIHYRMTLLEIESTKVRYIAEAGIYRTIAKIKTDAAMKLKSDVPLKSYIASETDIAVKPAFPRKEEVNWVRFGEGSYRIRVVSEAGIGEASTSGTRTNGTPNDGTRTGETSNSGALTGETPSNKVNRDEKADNKGEVDSQPQITPPILRLLAEGRLPSGAKSVIQVMYDTERNTIVRWEETSHE